MPSSINGRQTCRNVISSPILKPFSFLYSATQIRLGRKPDGVCLVVGSCARGFNENKTSDIIFSKSSTKMVGNSQLQYFWEAFPAGSGPKDRTTYMFTYLAAQEGSPKLEDLLEDYWDLLPDYQGVALDKLEILRVIFGIFPTYSDRSTPKLWWVPVASIKLSYLLEGSTFFLAKPLIIYSVVPDVSLGIKDWLFPTSRISPSKAPILDKSGKEAFYILRTIQLPQQASRICIILSNITWNLGSSSSPLPAAFDRLIQVGDASGIQSPVSFGGFGSMTRHLSRLTNGIYEALEENCLDSYSLGLLNPYMPNLRASWLFQRAMSAQAHTGVPPTFINELLYFNFQAMQSLGDPVLRPFLQDVIQFGPLVKTLGSVMLNQPQILPSIFKQVGIGVILDWSVHFLMLGYFTFLSSYIDPVIRPFIKFLPKKKRFETKRFLEAWMYGAGLDYNYLE